MNLRSRQAVRLLLLVVVVTVPMIGTAQLNPTVKVLPRASAPVPTECEQGLAEQPVARLAPEEKIPVVRDVTADLQPPPTVSLRGELRAAIEAAQRGNRDVFRDSLSRAKSILANYPPGGERTTAIEVVTALNDLDRLWEYEFTSPTGAFFEAGSDLYKAATRYQNYDTFIRRQIIVDRNGNHFYPSHETRDFLIGESVNRMAQVSGRPIPAGPRPRTTVTETRRHKPEPSEATPKPTPVPKRHKPPATPTESTTHHPRKKPVTSEAHATPPPVPRAHRTETPVETPKPTVTTHGKPKKPATTEAHVETPKPVVIAHEQPKKPAPTSTHAETPKPVVTTHTEPTKPAATPPAVATATQAPTKQQPPAISMTNTAPPPPPPQPAVSTQPPATTTTAPAPPAAVATTETTTTASSSTITTSSTTPATDTTTTVSSTTTTTSTAEATKTEAPSKARGFIIPLLLILVGLGVLVVLFRASS